MKRPLRGGGKFKTRKANEPMDLIPMPAALLSCLLLPLRGQESRQKRVGIGHRGRSLAYEMG